MTADVFPDKQMTRGGNLPLELRDWLSMVPSFCCASVLTRAYKAAFVIHSIDFRPAPRVESREWITSLASVLSLIFKACPHRRGHTIYATKSGRYKVGMRSLATA